MAEGRRGKTTVEPEAPVPQEPAPPDADREELQDPDASDGDVILPTNASPELQAQHEPKPASMDIERSDDRAWWCPYDDHANLWTLNTCGGCGAQRDGETVRKQQ